MEGMNIYTPKTIEDVFSFFSSVKGNTKVLAGGTDIIVHVRNKLINPDNLIDISGVEELSEIECGNGLIKIGSVCTLTDIAESELLKKHAPCLCKAALEVGSEQIRNRATIGGNIGNASPAADTVPALVVLGAVVTILNNNGERTIPLEEMFKGPGKTVLGDQEIIGHITFHIPEKNKSNDFKKIGKRKAMAISVANMAVQIGVDQNEGIFTEVRIALGSVAATVMRARETEKFLMGKDINSDNIETAASILREEIKPISDIRASQNYRKMVCEKIIKRLILEALIKIGIYL